MKNARRKKAFVLEKGSHLGQQILEIRQTLVYYCMFTERHLMLISPLDIYRDAEDLA